MNQKLENLLNLAIETEEAVRMQTDSLNTGFDPATRTWELIVKYHGSLDELTALNIQVEYLIAGYAILTVPEELVDAVSELEEIEYIEKPKRYFYRQTIPVAEDSCIYPLTRRNPFLTGQGILIAVLDSGIDYGRTDFRNADGTSRILYLWDQTVSSGIPPEGFGIGTEYSQEQINEALRAGDLSQRRTLVPSIDTNGHGTAVAGIAAGYSNTGNFYEGAAPQSSLLIVKLGLPREEGFPRTTEIMRGVTYAVKKAIRLNMPLVINLSFGNSYGSHDGSSLLERFLDNAAEIGRTVICVGSGNEGNSAGHAAGDIQTTRSVQLSVANYQKSLSVQLWTHYSDRYRIYLTSPGGLRQELPANIQSGKYTVRMEQTTLLIYLGEPSPYSVNRELYIEMLPADTGSANPFINTGIWQFTLEPVRIIAGQFYLYLPSTAARSVGTGFTEPTPQVTLTIPSTASKVITVGAYNSITDSYADFSGRGYPDADRTIGVVTAGLVKPDLAAPGVNILAPDLFEGYAPVTGTSFATPIVSGAAALLMEWGIERGNDPFLYGEKVKAYLRSGARPIRGEENYPNNRVGFGALCVADSLPT